MARRQRISSFRQLAAAISLLIGYLEGCEAAGKHVAETFAATVSRRQAKPSGFSWVLQEGVKPDRVEGDASKLFGDNAGCRPNSDVAAKETPHSAWWASLLQYDWGTGKPMSEAVQEGDELGPFMTQVGDMLASALVCRRPGKPGELMQITTDLRKACVVRDKCYVGSILGEGMIDTELQQLCDEEFAKMNAEVCASGVMETELSMPEGVESLIEAVANDKIPVDEKALQVQLIPLAMPCAQQARSRLPQPHAPLQAAPPRRPPPLLPGVCVTVYSRSEDLMATGCFSFPYNECLL